MKNIKYIPGMLTAAILISSVTDQPAKANDWRDRCKMDAQVAASVMKGRQKGVPMAEMMDVVTKNTTNEAAAEALVIAAYERPRYGSNEMRQRSVEDFHNDFYLACAQESRSK